AEERPPAPTIGQAYLDQAEHVCSFLRRSLPELLLVLLGLNEHLTHVVLAGHGKVWHEPHERRGDLHAVAECTTDYSDSFVNGRAVCPLALPLFNILEGQVAGIIPYPDVAKEQL